MQSQFAFDQFEGQFNIPAAGIQNGDVVQAQLGGMDYIGDVLVRVAPDLKGNQADGITGPVAR